MLNKLFKTTAMILKTIAILFGLGVLSVAGWVAAKLIFYRRHLCVNDKGELLNEGEDIIHENADGYDPHHIDNYGI